MKGSNRMGIENERYFIRINGEETGWVYIHTVGDFENSKHIHLWNEQIPEDIIERALKEDYKEISKKQYYNIVHAINTEKDATPFIDEALNK